MSDDDHRHTNNTENHGCVPERYFWHPMIFQSHNQFWKPAAGFCDTRRRFAVMALGRRICDLRTCSAGVVAVVTAMVLPVLLGFTSLGVEVGHWYLAQRQMQGAADAAAISAAAQYIADFPTNPSSLTYQTVGVNYASLNSFTIPTSNVCLVTSSGDNCSSVRSLDSRAIVCANSPCVVVEITQNTALWSTTQKSLRPTGQLGKVQAIPTPTIKARAIVSAKSTTTTTTSNGTDCVLALANGTNAVTVSGNGILAAACGVSIDGGRDQNVSGTPLGGITFNGGHARVNISSLVVASGSTNCPDDGTHCQQACSPQPCTAPKLTAILTNTATQDPYAATLNFPTPPSGVRTGGVAITAPISSHQGSGYTNGTAQTFSVVGGTGTPAKFTATVSGGKVTAIVSVIDPGAYTVFPTSPVSATPATGGGSGASFTLTEGCFTWNFTGGTPLAGRKYCSINVQGSGTTNFPTGNYYVAGGDSSCIGFCVSSANATVTSDDAGVTFFLTNGEGTGTYGTSSYATISMQSGTVSLCAPGTNTGNTKCTGANPGTTCDNTKGTWACMLFVQNPAATVSTGPSTPSNTDNSFAGNGTRTLSGLIYLPKQTFSESGNGPILGCFGVIAKYVNVSGTPTFADGCLPGHGIGGTTTTTTSLSSPYLYQ
jgi:Flp pilus assembly protein TadG